MASLYEINKQIDELLESDFQADEDIINYETGEVTTIDRKLDELELDLKTKLDNIGCYIKNLTSDIEAIRAEEKALAERRRVKENQLERLKNYLADNMKVAGYDKFESARCVLSFRTSKKVVIQDGAVIPEAFLKRKEIVEPDKKALTDALKEGALFDGITLEESKNLQIK